MSNNPRKISDLSQLTTVESGDYLPIIDISESLDVNKNKRITIGELLRGAPDGTAGAPGIAFESDGANGFYLAGTDTIGASTNGVNRLTLSTSSFTSAVPISATSFIPTSSTVPTNGIYLPDTNQVSISSNGAGRLFVDADGSIRIPDSTFAFLNLNATSARISLSTKDFQSTPDQRRWLTYPFKSYSHGTGLSTRESALVTELDWIISNYPGGTSSTVGTWEDNTSYWDSITAAYGFNTDTDIILHNRLFIGGRHPIASDDKECGLWIAPGGINGGTNTATNASITYGPVIDTDFGGNATTGALSAKIRLSGYVRGPGSDNLEFASINFDSQIHPYNANFSKGKAKIWAKNKLNYYGQQYGSTLVFGTSAKGPSSSSQTYEDRLELTENGDLHFLPNRSATIKNVTNNSLIFGTNNTERLRIDSSGRLLVGTSSARSNFFNTTIATQLQLEGTTGPTSSFSVTRNSADINPAYIVLGKTRSASVGGNTIVNSGDQLGQIGFHGSDGSELVVAATIHGEVDGTPGANDMPGRLVFSTTADGANSPTERLRITSDGNVGINTTSPASTLDVNGDITITDKIIHSGDTNTAIRFPANDTVSIETAGTERARITSGGQLLVGTSTARSNFFNSSISPAVQIEGSDTNTRIVSIVSSVDEGTNSGRLVLAHQRSGSVGGNTILQSGDAAGGISFQGSDGTEFVACADITATVDGTPGANDMPGRLVFSTTADGASSPTEQLRITSDRYVRLASGTGGIQFNGDTAAANALDDYEEGTWTPGGITGSESTVGIYRKIGRVVIAHVRALHGNAGSISASTITGLPFSGYGNGSWGVTTKDDTRNQTAGAAAGVCSVAGTNIIFNTALSSSGVGDGGGRWVRITVTYYV